MKANELRIGNYSFNDGYVIKISLPKYLDYAFNYEPIPITEEWLHALGFESNGSQFWYKGYDYTVDTRGNKFVVHSDYVAPIYGTEIQYVHQLQNLYFALTGEELVMA